MTPEEKMWKDVAGESFPQLQLLKRVVKDFSYENRNACLTTDRALCEHFIKSLTKSRKLLFSISDTMFSLHVGEDLLPLTDTMRDEVQILSDEIKIRHCDWRDLLAEFLKRIIKHDVALVKGFKEINRNLDLIFNIVIKESTKKRKDKNFWKKIRSSLMEVKKEIREAAILFKEREVLCNLHPMTLDRTFKKIQEEIRWAV